MTSIRQREDMPHKMRDLDQGYNFEVLDKKTKMLQKHRFFIQRKRKCARFSCCWVITAVLLIAWALFLLLWAYSRSQGVAIFTITEIESHPADLVRIPAELANKNGAYCLDGTVPSYYIRKAKSSSSINHWLVHLNGGGWCWDLNDCYLRTFSDLGSSDPQYLSPQMEFHGVLSGNPHINPDFHDWNVVMVNYCDGASFSGNMYNPVMYNDKNLYFRGSLVLDIVINYLLKSEGMDSAERMILSGNSAGGTAVVLHIDHVRAMLPKHIPLHGLVDAGIFLDARNMTNFDHFKVCRQRVYNIQQVFEGSLNTACMNDQTMDTKWKCFFTEYAYKYVQTPMFYINSAYDSWQLWFILEMHCHPLQCPHELRFMAEFNQKYIELVTKMKTFSAKNGMYISSCYNHCQAYWDEPFISYKVPNGVGKTPQQAIGDWYFERVPEGSSYYMDCEDPYDCNPVCDWSLDWYQNKTDRMKETRPCVL